MRSKFVFGTTPEGGKAKLCIGIEKGFFEKTLLWMVELANERIVQTGLPFLNEGHFEASIINFSDIRLIVTLACETGAHADECFVSVWTVAEN